jgi:hypothetical protein
MGIWETEIVSSKEGDLPFQDEYWLGVSLNFINTFLGFVTARVGLGSRLSLVTFIFEDEVDTKALVGSNFDPFTYLLGEIYSAMESPSENMQYNYVSNSFLPSRASLSQFRSS